jgi:polar amino acid transport system substrate-binding protein
MRASSAGMRHRSRVLLSVSALLAVAALSGCGGSTGNVASSATSAAAAATGAAGGAASAATGAAGGAAGSASSSLTSSSGAAASGAVSSGADSSAGGGAGQSAAALLPADIKQSGQLKVATGSGYPPFEFYGADNKTLIGVDPEIMQALGAAMGLKVTFADLKFDSIIPSLQAKRYDVGSAAMSVTPVRNKVVDFVSYFKGGTTLIVKAGNPSNLTLDSLCGHKLAVQKGTIYADDYVPEFNKACTDAGKPAINVDVYPDQPQATLALSSGRAEASMSDYGPLAYVAQQAKGQFEVLQENYKPSLYGIALPKGSALAPAIQAGLKQIIADGSYQKILQKWQVQAGAISDPTISTKS